MLEFRRNLRIRAIVDGKRVMLRLSDCGKYIERPASARKVSLEAPHQYEESPIRFDVDRLDEELMEYFR